MTIDGLVVVDKPPGWTSHDVVAKLRRVYGQRRIGHAGTLDPDATGVLLVGLGRATRLLRYLQDAGKAYRGTVVFGIATDTLDAAGTVVREVPMALTRGQVEAAAHRFVGSIEQVPPMVSAVKVGGRRLHELARKGEEVERAPRRVRVDRFEVECFDDGEHPEATVLVECSSGTYVRTLAADLGEALGGVAHLRDLRRLGIGSFTLADAVPLEAIEADPPARVLSPAQAMRDLAPLTVGPEEARAVSHGKVLPAAIAGAADAADRFAVLDSGGELLAVYERRGSSLRPTVVLASGEPGA